ncbi:transposase [Vibrio crassostreae]|uniref:transposase n=1 Tax=Vibrio crassostreae TaxID=246167 RepID=UPI004067EEE0
MGKAEKKITNWAEYNKALCKRGRGFQYSDTAIETALMIKGIFSLPLSALQGFIDSIFELLDVPRTTAVSANARRQFRSNIAIVLITQRWNKPLFLLPLYVQLHQQV